jgi:uncharacterized SAM-binding protein YcdF (DUF218 family)
VRLVVVLGYSAPWGSGLHPVCAARLETAAELASEEDAVLLSGRPEAELMRSAWPGPAERVLCDGQARVTAESASAMARVARDLHVDEVVAVTSWWHCRRTGFLFRKALAGSGIPVRTVGAPAWSGRLLLREVGAIALLPLHLRRARV